MGPFVPTMYCLSRSSCPLGTADPLSVVCSLRSPTAEPFPLTPALAPQPTALQAVSLVDRLAGRMGKGLGEAGRALRHWFPVSPVYGTGTEGPVVGFRAAYERRVLFCSPLVKELRCSSPELAARSQVC